MLLKCVSATSTCTALVATSTRTRVGLLPLLSVNQGLLHHQTIRCGTRTQAETGSAIVQPDQACSCAHTQRRVQEQARWAMGVLLARRLRRQTAAVRARAAARGSSPPTDAGGASAKAAGENHACAHTAALGNHSMRSRGLAQTPLTSDLLHLLPAQQCQVDLQGGVGGHLAAAALCAKAVCGIGRRRACAAWSRALESPLRPSQLATIELCAWCTVGIRCTARSIAERCRLPHSGAHPRQPGSHSGLTTSFTSSSFFMVAAAAGKSGRETGGHTRGAGVGSGRPCHCRQPACWRAACLIAAGAETQPACCRRCAGTHLCQWPGRSGRAPQAGTPRPAPGWCRKAPPRPAGTGKGG